MWSKARDFYTRWEALPGVNALARRFPLAGAKSGASVIVFKSAPPPSQRRPATGREGAGVRRGRVCEGYEGWVERSVPSPWPRVLCPRGMYPPSMQTHQARQLPPEQAEQASLLDSQLGPTGTLQPLTEDPAFTMCSRAKTFCPCCNFASSAGRGCVMHSTAMRAMRAAPGGDDGQGSSYDGGGGLPDGCMPGEDDLGLSSLSSANPTGSSGGGQGLGSGPSASELATRRPAETTMQQACNHSRTPPTHHTMQHGAPHMSWTRPHLPPSAAQEMEELVALLPAQYVMSTTLHDRLVHLQLLKRLRAQPELQVLSTWTQYTDRIGTEGLRQHLIFRDRPGSLGAVTGVLSKVGVNILEAAVFCTADGYALDIFSLSTPNPSLAALCDEEIRKFFLASPPGVPFASPTAQQPEAQPQLTLGAGTGAGAHAVLLGNGDANGAIAAATTSAMQAAGGADLFGVDDSMFADLKLTSLIAEGGMTRVWRGEWKAGSVPVAVKVLSQGGPSISPEALRSFVQESHA